MINLIPKRQPNHLTGILRDFSKRQKRLFLSYILIVIGLLGLIDLITMAVAQQFGVVLFSFFYVAHSRMSQSELRAVLKFLLLFFTFYSPVWLLAGFMLRQNVLQPGHVRTRTISILFIIAELYALGMALSLWLS